MISAFILAAGMGTRLRPFTDTNPKALFPIGGKTLIEWQIDMLHEAGIRHIVINVHHFAQKLIDFVRAAYPDDPDIRFSDESELLLETGGGLLQAAPLLNSQIENGKMVNSPVLVLNVDVLSNIDLRQVIAAHRPSDLATLVVSSRPTQRYFCFDSDSRLVGWTNLATGEVKSPFPITNSQMVNGQMFNLLAFSGMHIVSPDIFPLLADYGKQFSITNFYIDVCANHSIRAYVPSDYRMMDIGKTDQIHLTEAFVKSL